MSGVDCAAARDAIDELVAGGPVAGAVQAHMDACPACQSELAMARRIERVLASWPTPAPPAHFAAAVAAAARRETWRQEQVVDWGFNVALGVGVAALTAGLAGVVWVVGATAAADGTARVAVAAAEALLVTARAQATVVGTATALLVTTLGAWWWAEERARW